MTDITLDIPVLPVRAARRPAVIPASGALLPYLALAFTVAVWQLGGLSGLASLARGSKLAKTSTSYPSASHRS